MRRLKKGVAGFLTGVCCMAMMSMTAFAGTDTTPAGEYGLLKGELSGNRSEVVSIASVTQNPDNAYLIVKLDAKNKLGKTLFATSKQSSRGIVKYIFHWQNLTSDCYSVFGTQGVQGGRTYPSKAVYTYTAMD